MSGRIAFELNGQAVAVTAEPDAPLVELLRDHLGIASVRLSCGIGMCGTCTVLLDGRAVSGCLLLAGMVDGRRLETSEGLAPDAPEPEAFVAAQAYQCSFCIPAMVLTVASLRRQRPGLTADEAVEELAGNLCRCGTYPQIREAVAGVFDGTEGR